MSVVYCQSFLLMILFSQLFPGHNTTSVSTTEGSSTPTTSTTESSLSTTPSTTILSEATETTKGSSIPTTSTTESSLSTTPATTVLSEATEATSVTGTDPQTNSQETVRSSTNAQTTVHSSTTATTTGLSTTKKALDCKNLSSLIENNILSTESTSIGTTVNISCEVGYTYNGTSEVTCVAGTNTTLATWNDTIGTCIKEMVPLGGKCMFEDVCVDKHSICDNFTKQCVCKGGYYDTNGSSNDGGKCIEKTSPEVSIGTQTEGTITLDIQSNNGPDEQCYYIHEVGETVMKGNMNCSCSRSEENPISFSCLFEHGKPGTCYNLTVIAVIGETLDQYSQTTVFGCTIPESPNCSASLPTNSSVSLNWTAVTSSFTGYKIDFNGCMSECHTTTPPNKTFHTVQLLSSNEKYVFNIYTVGKNNLTSKPCQVTTRTAPNTPRELSFDDYNETSLTVAWAPGDNNTEGIWYSVQLYENWNNITGTNTQTSSHVFTGLKSGTLYHVRVTAYYKNYTDEAVQSGNITNWTYTKPDAVKAIEVLKAREKSITMNISTENDRFTSLRILFQPPVSPESNCSENSFQNFTDSTIITCDNLNSTTYYNVTVYTEAGNISSSAKTTLTNTAPKTPFAEITAVRTDRISINISQDMRSDFHYVYHVNSEEDKTNVTGPLNETIYNLTSGTEYTISIYAVFHRWQCDLPRVLRSFTAPDAVKRIEILKARERSITMNISSENDRFTSFRILFQPPVSPETNCSKNSFENFTGSIIITCGQLNSATNYNVTVYTKAGNISSSAKTILTNTAPETPSAEITAVRTDRISVSISQEMGSDFQYFYHLNSGDYKTNVTQPLNETIYNLTSGTEYNISIYAVFHRWPCDSPRVLSSFTEPDAVKRIEILKARESSITMNISTENDRFTSFSIHFQPRISRESNCSENSFENFTGSKTITCDHLNSTTNYNVTVYTKAGTISSLAKTKFTNTAPETPSAKISAVGTDRISISISKYLRSDLRYFYCVNSEQTKTNVTDPSNETIYNLTSGTEYNISIYAVFHRWSCDIPTVLSTFTVPSKVRNISVVAMNSTSLNVTWIIEQGGYEFFIVQYNCSSPDGGIFNCSDKTCSDKTNTSSILKGELTPGTACKVSVTPHAGTKVGEVNSQSNVQRTYEKAPGVVNTLQALKLIDKSDQLNVTWSKPNVTNGIIRKYLISVIQQKKDTCVKMFYINCSDCAYNAPEACEDFTPSTDDIHCSSSVEAGTYESDQEKFSYTITRLQPYTNYTVRISAFTMCEGEALHTFGATDEDRPGVPDEISATGLTANSINVTWKPPQSPNGIVTEYLVYYEYLNQECRKPGDVVKKNETIKPKTDDKNVFLRLQRLYSAWNYTVWIRASTSKGYGNKSETRQFTTLESKPETIEADTINGVSDAHSITVHWLPPCVSNGEIQYYNISWQNENKMSEGGTNSSDTTNITFTNILPFRNYTFKIAAKNSASQGNFSTEFRINSKIAKPYPPSEVNVTPLSSTSLRAEWKLTMPDLYTGPTSYTARATDMVNNTQSKQCQVTGFNATSCDIEDLDEYWNYSIEVEAITTYGNTTLSTRSNGTKTERTFEDKPGPVRNVSATPESNVTKVRSITVTWNRPTVRNLNGVLTGYFIRYIYNDTNEAISRTGPDKNHVVLNSNIKPGPYSIMVFAATKEGNGTETNANHRAYVTAGAPIRPKESSDYQIIRQAYGKKIDHQTELTVWLDRQKFLCEKTNGKPTKWGVIVAQESKATDISFFGSKHNFEQRLKTYKKWSDVKDSDNIEPYRTTDDSWSVSCSSTDTRSKRSSASPETKSLPPLEFIVGEDKNCDKETSGYCNGPLPSGRSYRVKSFVCTDGGCTESEYSLPIETESYIPPVPEPNPTAAIVAGIVSGVVVIICVLVVVYLKRRQKVCFAKSVEEAPAFDQPHIELKGTTNKFKPIVVKLADFPHCVDVLHKDSGLLFAEGFRLLKEQSPSHPTTTADLQACRPKTRYTNILPFDHSRVKLLPLDDEEGSDFINANYIPGYTSRREYIATQGPMPATKEDFWRMIWEQNVDIIVMLTRCVEKGKRKCDEYWPDAVQEPVYSGELILNVQSESVLSDYIIRVIELKLKQESRMVRHFSFLKWPDMGCPEDSSMLINFVKTVRQFVNPDNAGPMVVHCSAGVGRTGTFIAVDRLLQHIRDHDDVDVYSVLLDMRNHRCNMVQTEDQFIYIYECIKDFITTEEEDEEEEDEDEHLYANTGFGQNIYENTAFQPE